MTNCLEWLQSWFFNQSNGEWEHSFGIVIESLDNPGWSVQIDLEGTKIEGKKLPFFKEERSDLNWIVCRVVDKKFEGFGGSQNLIEILEFFRDWAV